MLRTKDFSMMDVVDVNGKKLGFVKDILVNFHEGAITGFFISPYNFFSRNTYVMREDVISFGKVMIIKKTSEKFSLKFKDFYDMDVIDLSGNIVGVLEDIIFDSSYKIAGIIVCTGILNKFFKGKTIILISDLIVGEDNILYFGNRNKINFTSMPHKLMGVE